MFTYKGQQITSHQYNVLCRIRQGGIKAGSRFVFDAVLEGRKIPFAALTEAVVAAVVASLSGALYELHVQLEEGVSLAFYQDRALMTRSLERAAEFVAEGGMQGLLEREVRAAEARKVSAPTAPSASEPERFDMGQDSWRWKDR